MVAEVCVETYSKNDLKKKEEVEKRPQNININPTNKRGMLRERERERESILDPSECYVMSGGHK